MQLPTIAAKIATLRRRERLLAVAWGFARWLLVVCVALAVACYIDWRVDLRQDTPMSLRAGMLVAQFVLAIVLGWFWIVRPLMRRRSDDDVALTIEEQTPGLDHRLISAVQLNRPGADTGGMSPEMIGVVTAEAEERAAAIDLRELTDGRLLVRAAGVVALVAVFAGSAFLIVPKTMNVLLVRQMLQDCEIPRRNTLTNVTPPVWPSGEGQTVIVDVTGDLVERPGQVQDFNGEISVESDKGAIQRTPAIRVRGMRGLLSDHFDHMTVEVPEHFGDVTFEAWYGDARLKTPGRVRRVSRPAIVKQDAWTILPSHCGTKPDGSRYRVEQPRGEIVGLPGSAAMVTCKAQKPIVKGRVEMLGVRARNEEGAGAVVEVKRTIELEVRGDEATAKFDLKPDESAYRIVVVDEHGFENADPPRRGVRIVPEEAPTVTLLPEHFLPDQIAGAGLAEEFEVEGLPIPLGGAIRIAYSATHPYGLGKATLQFRVNEGPWQPFPLEEVPATMQTGPFDPRRGAFANSGPGGQVQFHAVPSSDPEHRLPRTDGGGRFDFQTRALPDLKIGDRIEFFVEVTNRDPDSPQVGRSETRLKTVVTVPQLVQWIDATLRQEDRIRQLEQKQRGVFKRD